MNKRLKFHAKSPFFSTVKSRVDQYFKQTGKHMHASSAMWLKAAFFLFGFLGCYAIIISNILPALAMLGLAVLLGAFSAFVGFNVCHDAIHGSFSDNRHINKALSMVFNLLGASPYIWNISHNGVHHTFTNIPGHDEDLVVAPGLIRIEQDDPKRKIQRYQHWYAFPLYGLASISWAFRKDFLKMSQTKIGQVTLKHPKKEYFNLFASKALYYFLFIALPLITLDITWWQFLIGFLAMHLAQGFTMGLVFQLAHVVEGTDFPAASPTGTMEEAWAEHQMRTTANFCSQNRIAAFLLGGLNSQIEHHLFPKICHIHYRAIGKIVKQAAKEYHLPYIESQTFGAALQSHYRVLKKFALEAKSAKVQYQAS
ncbi:fatty acid desaturase [Flavobacterium akiainvivens]|uniref:Fatty acid desaturase n=1 Tax=Flavobacterium akiainvivens TaxID=1202724 RepID=A0A0N0RQG9_9FLAO|nr:acyl-CoA desaturase [Flavobacterium akiainvivens]KOS05406.1 fatty acid desaturase [Flavobacterium akiainvivens]